jgi:cytochrome c oxidase subunit 2
MRKGIAIVAALMAVPAAASWSMPAFAAGPENWQMGFGLPASETKARIVALHDLLMTIGAGIVVLVVVLLAFAVLRFRASRHPVPSKLTRLPWLEFGWTVAPIAVLGAIAVPSLELLAYESRPVEADITIKVSGRQWFWRYSYPDQGGLTFDSIMTPPDMLPAGEPRLLSVDNRMVVPAGALIRIQVTSSDVVHSFFVPALGMQIYAVPGRLNETWTKIDRPGVYFGQCNQICGLDHSFMPIGIEARPQAEFDAWVTEAAARFPSAPSGAVQ